MRFLFTVSILLIALNPIMSGIEPGSNPSSGIPDPVQDAETAPPPSAAEYSHFPVHFIENQGQIHGPASYYIHGSDKSLFFTATGIAFRFARGNRTQCNDRHDQDHSLRLVFQDAQQDVKPEGLDKQETIYSFFQGEEENWKTAIPTFGKLIYRDLWPGIDLVYSGSTDEIKYEFIVEPGADPNRIRLAYHGAGSVTVQENGSLAVTASADSFEDAAPFAYQTIDGDTKEVSMRYVPGESEDGHIFPYGFEIGEYDRTRPLVLDPTLLISCGFLGSDTIDNGTGLAVDSEGCAYITGESWSNDWPPQDGSGKEGSGADCTPDGELRSLTYVFVVKVNAQCTGLEYVAFFSSNSGTDSTGIDVDSEGNVYVIGETSSSEGLPVKVGPDLTMNGNRDGFICKLNADGTDMYYFGFIGGDDYDEGNAVCVDDQGRAYFTGYAKSDQFSLPVEGGPDLTFNGHTDAIVGRVSADGTGFDFLGYIGGDAYDTGEDLDIDNAGDIYITGFTNSTEFTFPVMLGPDLTKNINTDAFVAKIRQSDLQFIYCGYIGGNDIDHGYCIVADDEGSAYVAGNTESDETTFPTVVGPDLTVNGGRDNYIAKVNKDDASLDYCGFIGGDLNEWPGGIALGKDGTVYMTGTTSSLHLTFPVVGGPDLIYNGGYNDIFVAAIKPDGTGLGFCGYIGGSDSDYGSGIVLDELGRIYIAGSTESDENSFPVLVGPSLTTFSYNSDVYLARVVHGSLFADTYMLSENGGVVNLSIDAGAHNANRNYIILGGATGVDPGTPLPGGLTTLPLNWDPFTDLVLSLSNTLFFSDFMGTLSTFGQASAQIFSPALPAGHAGTRLYFALTFYNPFDFVSNTIAIDIVGS